MTASTAIAPAVSIPPERTSSPGMVDGAVRSWLRLEGLAGFGAGIALFGMSGGTWLFLIPLLLLPDISAAGYLAGRRIGTFTYNVAHTWAPGLLVLAIGVFTGSTTVQIGAAILIAHVGMDRAVGYGLKLPTSFQDTHLGHMGRTRE